MKIQQPSSLSREPFRFGFAGLALLLGLLMPILSRHYAVTWDEWMDTNYGFLVFKYILSLGKDTSYTTFWHGYLYSAFFFVLTHSLNALASGDIFHYVADFSRTDHFLSYFQISHLTNSLFGFYLFFFTGLAAKEVKGWRAAFLALLLIAISPRFFGQSMNNPKDIPFAATYMFTLYLMIRFFKQMPRPDVKTMLFLMIAIGMTMGTRVGGVILISYLFLFGMLFYALRRWHRKDPFPLIPWVGRLLLVAIAGYLVGLFFWPYGQINPFLNIFRALAKLSDFRFETGTIIFKGHYYPITQLPWDYLPVWIFITTPTVVLTGWFLFYLFLPVYKAEPQRKFMAILAFAGLFPMAVVILKHSVLYNDWRHMYFIYGPLVVFAALGWDHLLEIQKLKQFRAGFYLLLVLMAGFPVTWMVRNHPYQSLYFNGWVGGLKGAAGNFEIDYWSNTIRTGAEKLAEYHLRHFPDRPAYVRADGQIMSTYGILREKMGSRYFPYLYPDGFIQTGNVRYMNIRYNEETLDADDWDYAILLLNGQSRQDFRDGKWPPPNALFEVKVDGVPVCVITKNPRSPLFRKQSLS